MPEINFCYECGVAQGAALAIHKLTCSLASPTLEQQLPHKRKVVLAPLTAKQRYAAKIADIVVDLKDDGTYAIFKNVEGSTFDGSPRNERIFGVRAKPEGFWSQVRNIRNGDVEDLEIFKTLRDVYLDATYHERERFRGVKGAENILAFVEQGLVTTIEKAFEKLTGRKRYYQDVVDAACRTDEGAFYGTCTHCGLRGRQGIQDGHADGCPHYQGGSCQ